MAFYGRGSNKIKDPYTIPDFYESYCEKIDKDSPYNVSYSVFRDILEMYYKGIRDTILDKGLPFKFPCNLGEVKVVKKKVNFSKMYPSSIDWVNTIKYGKVIYHLNDHTDGYKYLFMWNKSNAKLKNISKYRFIPTRSNKRKLAFNIKNKVRDYFGV